MLPVSRVILSERDEYIASGLRTACDGRHRVVAILGFLHVNGVVDRLLLSADGGDCGKSISKGETR